MKPRSLVLNPRRGFTLVEVTIAIGIFAFAIVCVMGLMSVSFNADRNAAHDTVLGRMSQTTTSYLKTRGFNFVHTNSQYLLVEPDFYYDVLGNLQYDSAGKILTVPTSESVYCCAVIRKNSASTNLDYLSLQFRWPMAASEAKQETRTVTTSLARYE